MADKQIEPYGSWRSPISPDLIVSEAIRFGHMQLEGSDTYWTEIRPVEKGRYVIVRRSSDGTTTDINPAPFNARTRVHEYGGGDFTVSEGMVIFSNFNDHRLYRSLPGETPTPITPIAQKRYADAIVDRKRQRLICVCEDHTDTTREPINILVSIALDGEQQVQPLVAGNDFYSNPRLSPDGTRLIWLTWNHPNMPWDGNELWVGEIASDGSIAHAEKVAGGTEESIFQPQWSPEGELYFISDRTGWWNLYRLRNGNSEALCPKDAEFGVPQWAFGLTTYAFISEDRLICWYADQEGSKLAILDTRQLTLTPIALPYSSIGSVKAEGERVVFIGASRQEPRAIIQLDLATMQSEVLRRSSNIKLDPDYLSLAQPIEFPTENGQTAYAYYYPPTNPNYAAPEGELPPLLVESHGGPTASTSSALNLETQFWTSRGFAILDVNYGGSSGYGRQYRERLRGQWGVVDVDDCVNGAKYLIERGLVDAKRISIRGGSAGGYTTLCALTFRNLFRAGASHFGVSDLSIFVHDTHKFESRYLFALVGPYPEAQDLYYQRSPINFTDHLYCPIIFFQGLDDKIVPPNQAEKMVEALRTKKLPVVYLPFEGEQHGFRQAKNIKRVLESELYFYSQVFGFDLADQVESITIENL